MFLRWTKNSVMDNPRPYDDEILLKGMPVSVLELCSATPTANSLYARVTHSGACVYSLLYSLVIWTLETGYDGHSRLTANKLVAA